MANEQKQDVIEYLRTEIAILTEQYGKKRNTP